MIVVFIMLCSAFLIAGCIKDKEEKIYTKDADEYILKPSDFNDGWTETSIDSDPYDYDEVELNPPISATTIDMENDDDLIMIGVGVFKTVSDAKGRYDTAKFDISEDIIDEDKGSFTAKISYSIYTFYIIVVHKENLYLVVMGSVKRSSVASYMDKMVDNIEEIG